MDIIEWILFILIVSIVTIYFLQFYSYILKTDTNRNILIKFHNAVCNIYKNNKDTVNSVINNKDKDFLLEQLNLNYKKLCEKYPNNRYTNVLDILQTLVHYYDIYPNKLFKKIFNVEKELELRNFIMNMYLYIKQENPFISIPIKEANLLQSIQHALDENNILLGKNAIEQLSQEIELKEKKLIKQGKTNQITTIISIIGVVLTIFFGFISLIPTTTTTYGR